MLSYEVFRPPRRDNIKRRTTLSNNKGRSHSWLQVPSRPSARARVRAPVHVCHGRCAKRDLRWDFVFARRTVLVDSMQHFCFGWHATFLFLLVSSPMDRPLIRWTSVLSHNMVPECAG